MPQKVDDIERLELRAEESTEAPGERKEKASGSPWTRETHDAYPSFHGFSRRALTQKCGGDRDLVPSRNERPAQRRR